MSFAWRLGATGFFVLLNGFFVAAEFALVKVHPSQIGTLPGGSGRIARHIHEHLDRYLSACQLGITVASLVLGWLAEPAVAQLLLALAPGVGLALDPTGPLVHGVALGIALTIVTLLHMTVGEQAPKIWAINRAPATTRLVAYPLRLFELVFRPFIWLINVISNGLLKLGGMSSDELQEGTSHTAEELKSILLLSAEAGHLSRRQVEFARNVLDIVDLEVRHVLVPRVDVAFLSLSQSLEQNLEVVQNSGHSRFPLCQVGLDTVVGFVHAKDVLRALAEGKEPDLVRLGRKPLFVSETQSLSRLILQFQRTRTHCAVVIDEHGSATGLAFLEDAIEEIVGPIYDEFDESDEGVRRLPSGGLEMPGSLPLPEAIGELGLAEPEEDADTIAGYLVALLGRLPKKGDSLRIGNYDATVTQVTRHAIARIRFEPATQEE